MAETKVRLIDANALFEGWEHKLSEAVKYGNKDEKQQHFSCSTMMMYEIAGEIDGAPTVDAVPVVRCEECRFFNTRRCFMKEGTMCDTDFCSNGAKME